MQRPLRRAFLLLALAGAPWLAAAADAPSPATLKPGQFLWYPEIAPEGPIVLVVSLDEQRAYVYRNGLAIGVSTISSGKTGKETPTGVFTILQKNKDHRSNLYNNAPMPYMQRLTWDGIALHGGALPGYPASHGCVRLPLAFAEKLFAETRNGDTVVVADAKASPASLTRPAVLAPVDEAGTLLPAPEAGPAYQWNDAVADMPGPVSVLVSVADRRVFVMRNGVLAGEAPLQVADGFALNGSVLMVMGATTLAGPSLIDPGQPRRAWSAYPILGVDAESLPMLQLQLQSRPLKTDQAFAHLTYALLEPGSTVLLTDLPAVRPNPAAQMPVPVLESDETPAATGPARP